MTRTVLLAALTLAASVATPAASATTAEACVRQVRLTFDPPLGITPTSGRVHREQIAVCTRTDTATLVPYVVGFPGASSGNYLGNCLRAEVAGEFAMTIVGGGAGVLYATYPHYVVADALVLVPDQVCNVSSANGAETGPGLWP